MISCSLIAVGRASRYGADCRIICAALRTRSESIACKKDNQLLANTCSISSAGSLLNCWLLNSSPVFLKDFGKGKFNSLPHYIARRKGTTTRKSSANLAALIATLAFALDWIVCHHCALHIFFAIVVSICYRQVRHRSNPARLIRNWREGQHPKIIWKRLRAQNHF